MIGGARVAVTERKNLQNKPAAPTTCKSSGISQLPRHFDHRPPKAEPREEALRSLGPLDAPEHDARRTAASQPLDRRVDECRCDTSSTARLMDGDVMYEPARVTQLLPRSRLKTGIYVPDHLIVDIATQIEIAVSATDALQTGLWGAAIGVRRGLIGLCTPAAPTT